MMLATKRKTRAAAAKLSTISSQAPNVVNARPVSFLNAPTISLRPQKRPTAPASSQSGRSGNAGILDLLQKSVRPEMR